MSNIQRKKFIFFIFENFIAKIGIFYISVKKTVGFCKNPQNAPPYCARRLPVFFFRIGRKNPQNASDCAPLSENLQHEEL